MYILAENLLINSLIIFKNKFYNKFKIRNFEFIDNFKNVFILLFFNNNLSLVIVILAFVNFLTLFELIILRCSFTTFST